MKKTFRKGDGSTAGANHRNNGATLKSGGAARSRPRTLAAGDASPPNSQEVEFAALACVLQAGGAGSQPEVDALLLQLRPLLFFDLRHRIIYETACRLRMEAHAVDSVTLFQRLKADKAESTVLELHAKLAGHDTELFNFPEYLGTLREFALRRWTLAKSARLNELSAATELTAEDLQTEFAELYDKSQRIGQSNRERLKVWKVGELMKYEFPPHLALVGDNEITMGYDGLTIIAGPGSSGKSLAALALAVAGATGAPFWQGRKIHRKFKTLIIQAENGARRLREDLEGYIQNNPGDAKAIGEGVFISDPPEGGLCFNSSEFRAAVRRQIEELKPDLVQIDPWQSVASEDAAKEVIEMLNLIRSCYPSGDSCPGTIIVAHTNKPRADVVRTGRNLVYNISGSVALVNTARCVYVLLPWTAELEDHRVYWACVKLNNGAMYAPTVWLRRKGAPFLHDPDTEPRQFGKDGSEDERQAITEDELRAVFDAKNPEMRKADITRALVKKFNHAPATCYRAIDEDGYLRRFLMRGIGGKLKLQNP